MKSRKPSSILAGLTLLTISANLRADQDSTAQVKGDALAAELCAQRPAEELTTSGTLRLRDSDGKWREQIPVRMEIKLGSDSWQTVYQVTDTNGVPFEVLTVTHADDRPNRYEHLRTGAPAGGPPKTAAFSGDNAALPFAHSEFWLSDLGLEFLRWPQQRLLGHEMRKGRSCYILESTHPNPDSKGYARVVSWIDVEHKGLLRAEAYDQNRRLIKEFSIGSFKKVGGRWQLKSMEIRDAKSDARTRLEFNLEIEDRAGSGGVSPGNLKSPR